MDRIHDRKNTGNYSVRLVQTNAGEWELRIRYLGAYTGAQIISIYLDVSGEYEDLTQDEIVDWFNSLISGDIDVADLLAQAGYSYDGNSRGRPRPVAIGY